MKKPYRLFKRGNVWYYRLPADSSFHSTGQSTRAQAEKHVLGILKDGRQISAALTLRQFVDSWHFFEWGRCRWIRSQHEKGRSFSQPVAQQRRGHLDNYILPIWGNKLLTELDGVRIEQWLLDLALSNQTRNHIRTTLNIMFKTARRQGLIRHNPIEDTEAFANRWTETGAFTIAELGKLFPKDLGKLQRLWAGPPDTAQRWKPKAKVVDPRGLYWGTFFLLMATSGMRQQEVRALRWQAVRPDLGGVLVLLAAKKDGSIGEPKAREYRGILLPQRTLNNLAAWRRCTPRPGPENWVFFGRRLDEPISAHTADFYFAHGLQKAGIEAGDRWLIPHSLRHTYNTLLKGVLPGSVLRELTGHRSERMSDRYDHPQLEHRLQQLSGIRPQIDATFESEHEDM